MIKNLLIILFLTIAITGCKKDSDGDTKVNQTGLVVKGTASTPLRVYINVSRPVNANSSNVIENVDQGNIVNPYTFTSTKLQKGDDVRIILSTTKGQEITASVHYNGEEKFYITRTNSSPDGKAEITWTFKIQ